MQIEDTRAVHHRAPLVAALASVLLAGAGIMSPAWADLPPLQHQGAVTYVSGGIGIDESTSFKQAMSQYPLSLTFAQQDGKVGAYLADVSVVISNARHDKVLDTTAQGPYMLVKLPPGRYQVKATFNHETKTRDVTIGKKGSERLTFEWKSVAGANT